MTRSMTARSWAGPADSRSVDALLADDEGFTLAEVLVAIALFVIVSVASMTALYTLVKSTAITRNRVSAANLARQEIERLRGQNLNAAALDSTAIPVTLKGTAFTITPTMTPTATGTCAPGASRQVTVRVSWNNSGNRSVRYDTVLSC
jgi:prepilin-type N-terminal cleavage/methylation domain-containing protein